MSQTDPQTKFTMYRTSWCGFCHRLVSQLERAGVTEGEDYEVIDIEQRPETAEIVMAANNGNQTVPTLVYVDGTSQTNPSVQQVQEKLAAL